MSTKITCEIPKVGERLAYVYDCNLHNLCQKFREEHGRDLTYEETNKLHSMCVMEWREVTVLEVKKKGHVLVVQDDDGDVSELTHDTIWGDDEWVPSKGKRDDIKVGEGVSGLCINGEDMRCLPKVTDKVCVYC